MSLFGIFKNTQKFRLGGKNYSCVDFGRFIVVESTTFATNQANAIKSTDSQIANILSEHLSTTQMVFILHRSAAWLAYLIFNMNLEAKTLNETTAGIKEAIHTLLRDSGFSSQATQALELFLRLVKLMKDDIIAYNYPQQNVVSVNTASQGAASYLLNALRGKDSALERWQIASIFDEFSADLWLNIESNGIQFN